MKHSIILVLLMLPCLTMAQVKLENATSLGFGAYTGGAVYGQGTGDDNLPGFAMGAHINFSHCFTRTFGVMAGVDFGFSRSFFRTKDVYSYIDEPLAFNDLEGDIVVRSSVMQYHTPHLGERINMTYIGIPLQLFLQTGGYDFSIAEFHQSYISLGAKFMLPVNYTANGSYYYTTKSYGTDIRGTGTTLDEQNAIQILDKSENTYDLKNCMQSSLMLLACAEVGTMLKVNERGCLAFSVYAEYQITPTQFGSDNDLISSPDRGHTLVNNGYFGSSAADKMRYFQMGVRLQYNLFFNSKDE